MNTNSSLLSMIPLLVMCCIAVTGPAHGATVLYPAPAGAILSADYIVKVDGQQVSVYKGINGNSTSGRYSFAYFDFSGPVTVEVTMTSPFMETPIIRPTSKRIAYRLINNNTMSFPLSVPANISIEPDHNGIGNAPPLLLFANPLEANPIRSASPGVLYYGPGRIHTLPINGLVVPSNTTLYIAGGAILKGRILPRGRNITIKGRGIVDNQGQYLSQGGSSTNRPMLQPWDCTNLLVEGIILKDSGSWTVQIMQSSHVTISNVKIVSTVGKHWHDGIHVVNSSFVKVQDSFILSDDDCIGVSAFSWTNKAPIDTVEVTRSVLWSTNANNWRIGWMGHTPYMRNLTFTDLDIIHRNGTTHNHVVTMQPSGNGTVGTLVSNVRYENIRVEADYGWNGSFIELRPQVWGVNDGSVGPPGKIQGVYFKNIFLTGVKPSTSLGAILVSGPAETQYVHDVTFENVVRYGQVTTSATSPNVTVKGYTSNIRFIATGAVPAPLPGPTPTPSPAPAPAPAPANTPPTVRLTSPANGANFTAPATVTVTASATDSNGTVNRVEFYRNGALIGADATSPYSLVMSNLAAGSYSLSAKATDNAGASTTSPSVSISVTSTSVTQLSPPIITAPTNGAMLGSTSAAISWNSVSGAAGYLIRCEDLTGATPLDSRNTWSGGVFLYIDKYASTSITLKVVTGHAYRFWVHSAKSTFSYADTTSYSTPAEVRFSVASGIVSAGTGLTGQYFDAMNFTSAKFTRTDAMVDFNWALGSPAPSIGVDTFSVRWTGQVQPPYSQTYTFYVTGDDGVRLWVNGVLLIDKWIDQKATEWSGSIALTAGTKYNIKLEYYENTAVAVSQLRWSSASTPKAIIPRSRLFPNAVMPSGSG
jgi:polygalacturonase